MGHISKTLFGCHLAGFTYWDGIEVIDHLTVGDRLRLKAEPDNPFDPQAVAVYRDKRKIGYIPRAHNWKIAPYLNNGHRKLYRAFVNRISTDNRPEGQVGITVRIRKAA